MAQVWDVVVIGGGAAGFFGAIHCASGASGARRVLILEKSSRVLQKVSISGGGRCNVTHDCVDARAMATHYPRGDKALIGPLHHFGVRETLAWFAERGVALKTEADGRIFPTTDDSQTIVECLRSEASRAGVQVRTRAGVRAVRFEPASARFEIDLQGGERLGARRLLVATGGTRVAGAARPAEQLGHRLVAALPSLFTFNIDDDRLRGMQGLCVAAARVSIPAINRHTDGPVLITHWGLSGPAVLELSARGARDLAELGYHAEVVVDWLPGEDVDARFHALRHAWGKRQLGTRCPFEALPNRLWARLLAAAGVDPAGRWAEFSAQAGRAVGDQLRRARFAMRGKSTFKDEFVTSGGVALDEVDMRTMESRETPGAYFAGEVLNVDGVTGGFNFQNAWTTGYLAGRAAAASL